MTAVYRNDAWEGDGDARSFARVKAKMTVLKDLSDWATVAARRGSRPRSQRVFTRVSADSDGAGIVKVTKVEGK